MKNAIFAAAIALSAAMPARAQTNEDYITLLLEQDTIRTFYSPCKFESLKPDLEVAEMQLYFSQGFKLIAKVKMPTHNKQGHGIPECMYTFVRHSRLAGTFREQLLWSKTVAPKNESQAPGIGDLP